MRSEAWYIFGQIEMTSMSCLRLWVWHPARSVIWLSMFQKGAWFVGRAFINNSGVGIAEDPPRRLPAPPRFITHKNGWSILKCKSLNRIFLFLFLFLGDEFEEWRSDDGEGVETIFRFIFQEKGASLRHSVTCSGHTYFITFSYVTNLKMVTIFASVTACHLINPYVLRHLFI